MSPSVEIPAPTAPTASGKKLKARQSDKSTSCPTVSASMSSVSSIPVGQQDPYDEVDLDVDEDAQSLSGIFGAPATALADQAVAMQDPGAVLEAKEKELAATAKAYEAVNGNDGDTPEMDALKLGATQGFTAYGALGLKFNRALDGGRSEVYKTGAKTHAQKAELRKQWAEGRYQTMVRERTKTKSWELLDTTRGKYIPFAVIVDSEGGSSKVPKAFESATIAAENYIRKRIAMGGKRCRWNPLTERQEYLYAQTEHAETFTRCCAALERGSGEDSHQGPPGPPRPPRASDVKAKAKAKNKGCKSNASVRVTSRLRQRTKSKPRWRSLSLMLSP